MATVRDGAGGLVLGGAPLADLARDPEIGTPSYIYDLDGIAAEARALEEAFDGAPHLVCYAVKANTAGPIVRTLAAEGCGADVVSGGELLVALACGIPADKIVYSGVAKTDAELALAVEKGIASIQIESVEEIPRVVAAAKGKRARVSVRVNPSVDKETLDTHDHISTGHDEAKFGVPLHDVERALEMAERAPELELVGLTMHVGSQITSTDGYVEAARVIFGFARALRAAGNKTLRYVDTGGGFGIDYGQGCPVKPADFVRAARAEQRAAGLADLALYVEPGRALVGAHGVLLASVIQPKVARHRRWIMIDAGMNDLVRPAMYQAHHRIVALEDTGGDRTEWRVVGPVCESSDDFGFHPLPIEPPRHVAILDAGAYGYTMASRYNGRPFAAEVFLRGGKVVARSKRAPMTEWAHERASL
jgi:diaminopimelate decarboxylase